jgi:hypothetical protein
MLYCKTLSGGHVMRQSLRFATAAMVLMTCLICTNRNGNDSSNSTQPSEVVTPISISLPSLPGQQSIAPIVNGFADPTKIKYDENRFNQFLQETKESSEIIICGTGPEVEVITSRGPVTVRLALRHRYLGYRFHYKSLIRFLESRVGNEITEKRFEIVDERLRKYVTRTPWERDLQEAMGILGRTKEKEAKQVLLKLSEDKSAVVRKSAIENLALINEPPRVPTNW